MTKRNILWAIGISFVVVSLTGITYGISKIKSITLTETHAQTLINARLPFTKKSMTVNAIHVEFLPDLIQLSFQVDGQKFKQAFHVSAQATGKLMYNGLNGTFYFHPSDIKIIELTFRDERIKEKVEKFIDRFVESRKLDANKELIGSKAEEWVHAAVTSSVTRTLKTIPIYKLPNNIKGNAVRMLLKTVEIEKGMITAHLSFWQLTKMIALYGLIFLIGIGTFAALFMYPGLGMTAFIIGSLGDS